MNEETPSILKEAQQRVLTDEQEAGENRQPGAGGSGAHHERRWFTDVRLRKPLQWAEEAEARKGTEGQGRTLLRQRWSMLKTKHCLRHYGG